MTIHDSTGHLSAWSSDPSSARWVVGQHPGIQQNMEPAGLIPDCLVRSFFGFALSGRRVLVHCDADAHL
jgi:hypothetical protein